MLPPVLIECFLGTVESVTVLAIKISSFKNLILLLIQSSTFLVFRMNLLPGYCLSSSRKFSNAYIGVKLSFGRFLYSLRNGFFLSSFLIRILLLQIPYRRKRNSHQHRKAMVCLQDGRLRFQRLLNLYPNADISDYLLERNE